MFNFNLQNKAFEELNAEQFRVVYFLNNTLSMVNKTNNTPNNNTIEMYNGYMMDKLGLSVRMVQYHIKTLEQLGYIKVVRPIGRNARKQPNKITINNAIDCALSENNTNKTTNDAINNAINDAMDCTPNKNKIKYKNNNITTGILEHKDLERIVTEENKKEKNNKKEKLSDQSSMDVNVSEPENKIISFKKMIKENEMSDNGTSVMNAISEQSERQAKENESSGCDKINEMKSSKSGDQNKIEDKVTSPKVSPSSNNNDPIDDNVTGDKDMSSSFKNEDKVSGISDQNAYGPKNTDDNKAIPSKDDMAIDPNNSDVNANKASGDLKNPSMDNLSNPIEKMEPDAPESPKTEFKRTSLATPNNINDTGTILQDTQVKNNESLSQPQVNNILPLPTALEEDTDPRIAKTIHNIDFSMNAMYKGRYDYGQFSSQYEYFTLQCHNLNVLMGDDKYQLYKKQYITPWWNKTKEYFPDGYEKLLKKPTQWEIDKFKKFYNWMEHAQEEREVASAYNNICVLLEHLNSKYGEKTLDALTNQIIHEISAIKHRNNNVSNYIEKIQVS